MNKTTGAIEILQWNDLSAGPAAVAPAGKTRVVRDPFTGCLFISIAGGLFRPLAYDQILFAGAPIAPTRRNLNFVGAGVSVADNPAVPPGEGSTEVTIPGGGGVVQTAYARLAAPASTGSATFATLLSIGPIVTGANRLECWFSASIFETITLTGARAEFRLRIDGVVQEQTATEVNTINEPQGCSLNFRSAALAAGPHTIDVQWRRLSILGTINISPHEAGGTTNANLMVNEVSV